MYPYAVIETHDYCGLNCLEMGYKFLGTLENIAKSDL
jgi:hypothetical protein